MFVVYVVAFRHKTPGEGVGGFEWNIHRQTAIDRVARIGVFDDENYETFETSLELPDRFYFTPQSRDATQKREAITDYVDAKVWHMWRR